MIHLMLHDLSRPAGVGLCACLHLGGLILHLDALVSLALAWAAEMRQAAFLGFVDAVTLDDLGVEHHRVCRCSSAFVEKCDDALANAYHIRRHADARLFVCNQCFEQVICDLQIFFCSHLRLPCEKNRIMHQFSNHVSSPFS